MPAGIDPTIAVAGLIVGAIVGMTGMGGGALMTPILVLFFRVEPLAAVGSDLVASLFMKPVGTAVHWRRGTVEKGIAGWLLVGSVPAAFSGVFLVRLAGQGAALQARTQLLLGAALVIAAGAIVVKSWLGGAARPDPHVVPRPLATIAVGAVGGLIVGMTSVGSGSLVIVFLMALYPALSSRRLVGTDLAQAIPMVGAAALGHLLFGEFKAGITLSILVGGIPGVYAGSRLSAAGPDFVIRPLLVLVLFAAAVKLLGWSPFAPAALLGGFALSAATGYFTWIRARAKTPALAARYDSAGTAPK
jgi:uncharacterized membrane protein YfcA